MQSIRLNNGKLVVFEDAESLAKGLAERFASLAEVAVKQRGRFTVALSGGSTPQALYCLLAKPAVSNRVPWNRTHLFWGDERCVPRDSSDSNYRMVREALIDKVPLPSANIHAPAEQDKDPARAAELYERSLREFFVLKEAALPEFDLILLGLGQDGHTASLFPGTPAVEEKNRLVTSVYVEHLQSWRMTFTLPVLNSGRSVVFMVAGADKKETLARVLTSPPTLPSQLVQPLSGDLEWFVDREAAAGLDIAPHSQG